MKIQTSEGYILTYRWFCRNIYAKAWKYNIVLKEKITWVGMKKSRAFIRWWSASNELELSLSVWLIVKAIACSTHYKTKMNKEQSIINAIIHNEHIVNSKSQEEKQKNLKVGLLHWKATCSSWGLKPMASYYILLGFHT